MGAIISCSKKNNSVMEVSHTMLDDDNIDQVVCNEEDIPENGMKSFPIGEEGEVLVVRHADGKVTAVGSKCTHYGAPLVKGVLGEDGTIRCPWHGACFNSVTGDIEDFPGLDSLPCYSVTMEAREGGGRQVRVRARRSQVKNFRRVQTLAQRDPNNNSAIVVVGGGAAGATCAETLRQQGFTGRVVLVCGEALLPYDRPKLSKNMAAQPDKIALRTEQYYADGGIELERGNPVLSLNCEVKQLLLMDGKRLNYDKLFIATGGRPRQLSCPGASLNGVAVLRNPGDAADILQRARGHHIVVVGASFIGIEVASHLATLNICESVSVVGSSKVAFERSLGSEVGAALQKIVEKQGVKFYNGDAVVEIQGDDKVEKVLLRSGAVLPADVVLCGVGVAPATHFLEGSGIALDDSGHVLVNEFLESNISGVFSGGDIVRFPLHFGGQLQAEQVNIGHWQVAQYHGRTAASNLLANTAEERKAVNSVPTFWTVVGGKSLRYAGYAGVFDEVLVRGDLDALSFTAHYLRGGRAVALAALGKDPAVAEFAELLRRGAAPTKEALEGA